MSEKNYTPIVVNGKRGNIAETHFSKVNDSKFKFYKNNNFSNEKISCYGFYEAIHYAARSISNYAHFDIDDYFYFPYMEGTVEDAIEKSLMIAALAAKKVNKKLIVCIEKPTYDRVSDLLNFWEIETCSTEDIQSINCHQHYIFTYLVVVGKNPTGGDYTKQELLLLRDKSDVMFYDIAYMLRYSKSVVKILEWDLHDAFTTPVTKFLGGDIPAYFFGKENGEFTQLLMKNKKIVNLRSPGPVEAYHWLDYIFSTAKVDELVAPLNYYLDGNAELIESWSRTLNLSLFAKSKNNFFYTVISEVSADDLLKNGIEVSSVEFSSLPTGRYAIRVAFSLPSNDIDSIFSEIKAIQRKKFLESQAGDGHSKNGVEG